MTVLSAPVVALALVAQATAFGPGLRLSLYGASGRASGGHYHGHPPGRRQYGRLWTGDGDESAPPRLCGARNQLEPCFMTARHDDQASVLRSSGMGYRRGLTTSCRNAQCRSCHQCRRRWRTRSAHLPDASRARHDCGPDSGRCGVATALRHGALAVRIVSRARRAHRPPLPTLISARFIADEPGRAGARKSANAGRAAVAPRSIAPAYTAAAHGDQSPA